MKYSTKWWNFPRNYNPNIFPLYVMAWKIPCGIIAYIGIFIAFFGIFMGSGLNMAKDFLNEVT